MKTLKKWGLKALNYVTFVGGCIMLMLGYVIVDAAIDVNAEQE